MSKYTKGPWKIVEKTDQKIISHWSIQIGKHAVSFFPYQYHYANEEKTLGAYGKDAEMMANARLISAAPDLLEALQLAVGVIEDEYGFDDSIAVDCRAAIAKALGETP